MKIDEINVVNRNYIDLLLDIWEKSVRATHLFLSDNEILEIKKYVPTAIKNVEHLVVCKNNNDGIVGFMGCEGSRLEMLFVLPEQRGKGVGKQLLQYGIEVYKINKLTVNEQNPQAVGFYEHMGFKTYKRTDYDEQGNPYPLLYMKL